MLARKRLSSKRMIAMIGALAVIWGTIGVVVYRSFFVKPEVTSPVVPLVPSQVPASVPGTAGPRPIDSRFDRSVLQDSRLTGLKVFGEVPLEVRARGKQNPFEPYEP